MPLASYRREKQVYDLTHPIIPPESQPRVNAKARYLSSHQVQDLRLRKIRDYKIPKYKPPREYKNSEFVRKMLGIRKDAKLAALNRDLHRCRCCGWSDTKGKWVYREYPARRFYSWTKHKTVILAQCGKWEREYYTDISRKLEVHHIIPLKNRGSDHLSNLITLCSKCHNSTKTKAYNKRFIPHQIG